MVEEGDGEMNNETGLQPPSRGGLVVVLLLTLFFSSAYVSANQNINDIKLDIDNAQEKFSKYQIGECINDIQCVWFNFNKLMIHDPDEKNSLPYFAKMEAPIKIKILGSTFNKYKKDAVNERTGEPDSSQRSLLSSFKTKIKMLNEQFGYNIKIVDKDDKDFNFVFIISDDFQDDKNFYKRDILHLINRPENGKNIIKEKLNSSYYLYCESAIISNENNYEYTVVLSLDYDPNIMNKLRYFKGPIRQSLLNRNIHTPRHDVCFAYNLSKMLGFGAGFHKVAYTFFSSEGFPHGTGPNLGDKFLLLLVKQMDMHASKITDLNELKKNFKKFYYSDESKEYIEKINKILK